MKFLPRLSRRELLALSALPVAGLAGWSISQWARSWGAADRGDSGFDPSDVPLPDDPSLQRFQRLARELVPLFSKLAAPQPDEWLAQHEELGQTLAQFVANRPDKLSDRYRRIALVPLGELSVTHRQLCDEMGVFLERFFGFPVEHRDPVSLADLPEQAQRVRESGSRQLRTSHLINNVLLPLRQDDLAAVVGVTSCDLWDGDYSFLFGQGAPAQRVCICSLARFGEVDAGEVDYVTCLRRAVGLAVHETGHVFGLPHCITYSCRMNGSNHLAESDRRPLEYCPECLPKIWWSCPVDPARRCAELAEFGSEHRLKAEARLWQQAGARLADAERTPP